MTAGDETFILPRIPHIYTFGTRLRPINRTLLPLHFFE